MIQGKLGPFRISLSPRGGLSSLFPGVRSIMESRGGIWSSTGVCPPYLGIFRNGCILPGSQLSSSPRAGISRGGDNPTGPPATQPISLAGLSSHQLQGTPRPAHSCHHAHAMVGHAGKYFTAPVSAQAPLPTCSTAVKV